MTDPEPLPDDPALLDGRPEAKNLVTIYAALADESAAQVLARFAGQGFGAFKPALADLLVESLRPIGARLAALTDLPTWPAFGKGWCRRIAANLMEA